MHYTTRNTPTPCRFETTLRLYTKPLFILALILIGYLPGHTQDPRFAQFYKAPIQLNPALSGVFNGQTRVHLNYRSLFASVLNGSSFETYAAGVDLRFPTRNRRDAFSASALLFHDLSGQNGFNRSFGSIGGAYLKQLKEGGTRSPSHYLSVGAQVGAGQYRISSQELWFSNQYDGQNLEIDFDRDSGEPIGSFDGNIFLDVNAGLLYYAFWEDRRYIFVGGAVHHANQPLISFLDNSESQPLNLRWSAHMGGEVPLSRNFSILPAAVYTQQGQATSFTAGGNARFSNWNRLELNLRAGPWLHFSNRHYCSCYF